MQKLKIAQVAPLWFPVPPEKYGGTERIISFLTEGLVEKGHRVTLFAPGNSKTKAKLITPVDRGLIPLGVKWNNYWWNPFCHSMAFERADEFDIIHCHWGIMGAYFQRFVKTPVIHTMHNIPSYNDKRWEIFNYYKNELKLVFISKSEQENANFKSKNTWVIYNGIDLAPFQFNPEPEGHFIWVARICPAKGPENAIKIAKKAGVKLLLAGQIQPQQKKYFEDKIKPHLNGQIQYVGELDEPGLVKFYAKARACLYPIAWEEPFGLVMAESMACGTPVIAFNRGSVPEVVKDGETGFVVEDIEGAIKAIKKINQIDRSACRKWVEENFSTQTMVDNYEKLYYEILRNKI